MAEAMPFRLETFTAGDGYCWQYRHYPPAGTPRGQVVCIHGIQSHGGWYVHSCTRLSQAGFAVYFLDRRGAGLNQANRGDAPGFRRLLDDIAEFLKSLRQQQGQAVAASPRPPLPGSPPIFLVGISWGGKLVTALQRRHPGLVDGLALLCPGFFPIVKPPLKQRLGILCSRLISPRRVYPIPLNDPGLFTATPRWQDFIRDDPLALREATARLLIESVRLDGYLRFVPRHVTLPVLLLLAEHDRIISNQRTRVYAQRFASGEVETIEYPGAHHTLEFEPDPDRFIGDLVRWLEKCSKHLER